MTKNCIGEKNGQIKGMISMRMLILSHTIQVVVPKFKILDAVVSELYI